MPTKNRPPVHRHTMALENKRPIPIDRKKHERIIEDMRGGDWPAMIALKNGIAPATLLSWVLRGLNPDEHPTYRDFADDFVRVEAEISGQLVDIIMKSAMGKLERRDSEDPYQAPNVDDAKWLLVKRFQFLWAQRKDGSFGGESAAEVVCRKIEEIQSEEREKVRKLLARLPEDAKREARAEGFLVP